MIVLVFLHMGRVFFFGAYKYPRELNWLIGVVLLLLVSQMALTGYLLPFDQRSYWATVVAVNINGTGPVVGPYLADFLRGGSEFGATTLSRFYAIHMLLHARRDRGADRRAPVPGHAARHHRAAVGARQGLTRRRASASERPGASRARRGGDREHGRPAASPARTAPRATGSAEQRAAERGAERRDLGDRGADVGAVGRLGLAGQVVEVAAVPVEAGEGGGGALRAERQQLGVELVGVHGLQSPPAARSVTSGMHPRSCTPGSAIATPRPRGEVPSHGSAPAPQTPSPRHR